MNSVETIAPMGITETINRYLEEKGRVEGKIEGRAEGKVEGIEIAQHKFIAKLYEKGYDAKAISELIDMKLETVQEMIKNITEKKNEIEE